MYIIYLSAGSEPIIGKRACHVLTLGTSSIGVDTVDTGGLGPQLQRLFASIQDGWGAKAKKMDGKMLRESVIWLGASWKLALASWYALWKVWRTAKRAQHDYDDKDHLHHDMDHDPIASIYGIFTYIYLHLVVFFVLTVAKCSIHSWYGHDFVARIGPKLRDIVDSLPCWKRRPPRLVSIKLLYHLAVFP